MNKFIAIFLLLLIAGFNTSIFASSNLEAGTVHQTDIKNTHLPYDFTDTKMIPIKLAVVHEVNSEKGLIEGHKIDFKVIRDVYCDEKLILKRGDIVKGRVDTIVTSGMNGFPAEVMFDDFEIPGISQSQLISGYVKKGQNRCFWVYPLKWALTIIPLVGSLTNFIKGGHVKLRTSDVITVYYYPNWP